MKTEIRFFKKSERALLLDAINKLWKHNHIYARNPAVLEHLVLNTPWRAELAGEENYSFVGMWVDNELVGLNGAVPFDGNILGKSVRARSGTIWFTKKIEGKSINGLEMGEYIDKKWNTELFFGFGMSEIAERIERLMGSYVTSDINRWILVKNLDVTAKYLLPNKELKAYLPTELNISFTRVYHVDVDEIIPERWDDFYYGTVAPRTIGVSRSYKFLKWRYIESPVLKYHFLTVKDSMNHYLGLAVFRIESLFDGTYSIGRILEFISFDVEASADLARAILEYDPDVIMWDFYCISDVSAFGLETVGFRKIPVWSNQMRIPTRFHPVDFENMKMNVAVRLAEEYKNTSNPIDSSVWYATRAEGDQDRAN